MQVAGEIKKVGKNIKKLKVLPVYGGEPIGKQLRVLKKGVHVVVGTPGRVIDHINRGSLNLIGVETVVLDEVIFIVAVFWHRVFCQEGIYPGNFLRSQVQFLFHYAAVL